MGIPTIYSDIRCSIWTWFIKSATATESADWVQRYVSSDWMLRLFAWFHVAIGLPLMQALDTSHSQWVHTSYHLLDLSPTTRETMRTYEPFQVGRAGLSLDVLLFSSKQAASTILSCTLCNRWKSRSKELVSMWLLGRMKLSDTWNDLSNHHFNWFLCLKVFPACQSSV